MNSRLTLVANKNQKAQFYYRIGLYFDFIVG